MQHDNTSTLHASNTSTRRLPHARARPLASNARRIDTFCSRPVLSRPLFATLLRSLLPFGVGLGVSSLRATPRCSPSFSSAAIHRFVHVRAHHVPLPSHQNRSPASLRRFPPRRRRDALLVFFSFARISFAFARPPLRPPAPPPPPLLPGSSPFRVPPATASTS